MAEGILRLLADLQDTLGLSYMFITHDLAVVRNVADRVAVFQSGQLVELGETSQIMSPPHPEYTQLLLNSVPEMDPDWLTKLVKLR